MRIEMRCLVQVIAVLALFLISLGSGSCLADDAQAAVPAAESGNGITSQTNQTNPAGAGAVPEADEPDPLFDDDLEFEEPPGFPDPFERTNRNVLIFNELVDRSLVGPIIWFFGWVTPDQAKLALRRVFVNLNTPVVFTNDLLQLEWQDAGVTLGALVINSTVGLGGLFEPARRIGLERHRSDFGQTLTLAGVPSGPFLMVPVTGPTNVRDGMGTLIDVFLRPSTYIFGIGVLFYYGGEGLVAMEEHHSKLSELKRSSVDFYPVLKSAYYQNRMDQIWSNREHRRPQKVSFDPMNDEAAPRPSAAGAGNEESG
jgi:phospholipid-binding lipoprotein MlaA